MLYNCCITKLLVPRLRPTFCARLVRHIAVRQSPWDRSTDIEDMFLGFAHALGVDVAQLVNRLHTMLALPVTVPGDTASASQGPNTGGTPPPGGSTV